MSTDQRVRVLRVIEYDYPDLDTMHRQMGGWTCPPMGEWIAPGGDVRMRSTVMYPHGANRSLFTVEASEDRATYTIVLGRFADAVGWVESNPGVVEDFPEWASPQSPLALAVLLERHPRVLIVELPGFDAHVPQAAEMRSLVDSAQAAGRIVEHRHI